MRKKIILAIALFAAGIVVIVKFSGTTVKRTEASPTEQMMSMNKRSREEKLRTDMRKLWEDHVTWTRNVIFCIIDGLPGTDQAVARLLKNQNDIGDAIKPYYGMEAGKKLTDLLHVHITTAADLLKATRVDDKKAFDEANKKWIVNADEISMFLCSANPHWKLEEMKMMMREHLKLTTDEAVARKNRNYTADVMAYENVHEEILRMSDMISNGVIKQFPDKFKENLPMGMSK